MTRPIAPASITVPIATGAVPTGLGAIQRRIAGSTDTYSTATTNSPGSGTGTGTVVSSQSDAFGSPDGRAARRI